MHRLVVNQVVDAAIPPSKPTTQPPQTTPHRRTTLPMPTNSTDFMQHGTTTTTVGGVAWLPHVTEPSTVSRYASGIRITGDRAMVLPINAPAAIGGDGYGLRTFEICVDVFGRSYVSSVSVYRTNSAASNVSIFSDSTDRTTDGCYAYTVDKSLEKGGAIHLVLADGGTIRIGGTSFTWTQGADTLAATGEPGGAEDGQ